MFIRCRLDCKDGIHLAMICYSEVNRKNDILCRSITRIMIKIGEKL